MRPKYEKRSGKHYVRHEGRVFGPFSTEELAAEHIGIEFGVDPATGERFFDMPRACEMFQDEDE